MQLAEFVKETLVQIIRGVKDAQNALEGSEGSVSPPMHMAAVHMVAFDVAVTTAQNEAGKPGAGIFVAGFGVGTQGEEATSSSTVSRIKFEVPVQLP